MFGDIWIYNDTDGAASSREVVGPEPQTTAAGTHSDTIANLGHGTFYAEEVLSMFGSFTYGSVPGCGRVATDEVQCVWKSARHFY